MTQPTAQLGSTPPDWRRPPGVAPGTWEYVHQRSIARHYDGFVADTPLCRLDWEYLKKVFGESEFEPKPIQNTSHHQPQTVSRTPQTVVDLGCGTGRLAIPLCDLGFDVLAVDLSQSMLCELAQKAATLKRQVVEDSETSDQRIVGEVFPVCANLVELSGIADQVADHAICMFSTLGMIQGRPHRRRFLSHVRRIVRPQGKFILHVHRRWAALHERGGWRRLLASRWNSIRNPEIEFGDSVYAYRGLENMFMHRFSRGELQSDLKQAGWDVMAFDCVSAVGDQTTKRSWKASGFLVVCG